MNQFTEEIFTLLKDKSTSVLNSFSELNLDKNNFCIMPFVNISLEPDGNIGICRHKGSKHLFGNIRNHSIDEIWSSEALQKWRQEFSVQKSEMCSSELLNQKCNLCPELNKLLPYAETGNIKNPKVLRLTANLNGKCNLECQMCDIWKLPNGFYNEENFWKPAREKFFKDIREVDMLSGEPFIQPDTYKLIDEISAVNPDCEWTITTNMHWKLTDLIKKKLDKIKVKNIIISIDSLEDETYKKIRKKGDIHFVKSNITELLKYDEERRERGLTPLSLRLNCLIQKDNWREASSVINFCLKNKIIPFLTYLYEPSQFSLNTASDVEKTEILEFYFNTLTKKELLFCGRVITPLIHSLDKIHQAYFLLRYQELKN